MGLYLELDENSIISRIILQSSMYFIDLVTLFTLKKGQIRFFNIKNTQIK